MSLADIVSGFIFFVVIIALISSFSNCGETDRTRSTSSISSSRPSSSSYRTDITEKSRKSASDINRNKEFIELVSANIDDLKRTRTNIVQRVNDIKKQSQIFDEIEDRKNWLSISGTRKVNQERKRNLNKVVIANYNELSNAVRHVRANYNETVRLVSSDKTNRTLSTRLNQLEKIVDDIERQYNSIPTGMIEKHIRYKNNDEKN